MIKPANYNLPIGAISSGIHPYYLGIDAIRRVKVLSRGFDLLDDYAILELPKKKVKLTYRSIDSEWEPTKNEW